MKNVSRVALLIAGAALLLAPSLCAQSSDVNPNGFPSGAHYNLNILGKKDGFACPPAEIDPLTLQPVYGNVIFVPESGLGIQIMMQSGKGSKAAAITTLQVLDPCTAAFDGTPALMQLPKNDLGYRVYARALAKPTNDPSMRIDPALVAAEDESGNDLVYLGLVTSNGFETPYQTLTRTKGKSTAIPITGLFNWSGSVCYFNQTYCDPPESCTETQLCCTDSDGDGLFDECHALAEGEICAGTLVTGYCRTYVDTWVFNIADFVTYLWSLDNSGVKLLQVRFYPVTQ